MKMLQIIIKKQIVVTMPKPNKKAETCLSYGEYSITTIVVIIANINNVQTVNI